MKQRYIIAKTKHRRWSDGHEEYTICDDLRTAQQDFEECAASQLSVGHAVAIFYYRPHWQSSQPLYLRDSRDKSGWPISEGLGGIINTLPSNYF